MSEVFAGLRHIVGGITLGGVALAALAQLAFVLAAGKMLSLPGSGLRRLARSLAVGDGVVAVLFVAIGKAAFHFNHGSHDHRVGVIAVHLAAVGAVAMVVWAVAAGRGAGRRMAWAGPGLFALTFGALSLPGVWLSNAGLPARVSRVEVRLESLPDALDGMRIALVSDIHVGGPVGGDEAAARLAPLKEVDADLVVFAGDLASQGRENVRAAAEILGDASPEAQRVAVCGNHDLWTDKGTAVDALEEEGFTVLSNEAIRWKGADGEVWIAGVDDPYVGAARVEEAMAEVPEEALVILVSHGPDVVREEAAGRAGLILAGHTHGGQVAFPLVGPVACSSQYGPRYASGLYRVGGSALFVTRGLGEVVLPFRLFCEPEVAVLELRKDAE